MAGKGTYCLVFKIDDLRFKVRSSREFSLKSGYYIYVGSAFGSGGIEKRVERHLKREKKKHWHIDHITSSESFKPVKVLKFEGLKIECQIASFLQERGKPILGFGSSDCKCLSHLFRVKSPEILIREIEEFVDGVQKRSE